MLFKVLSIFISLRWNSNSSRRISSFFIVQILMGIYWLKTKKGNDSQWEVPLLTTLILYLGIPISELHRFRINSPELIQMFIQIFLHFVLISITYKKGEQLFKREVPLLTSLIFYHTNSISKWHRFGVYSPELIQMFKEYKKRWTPFLGFTHQNILITWLILNYPKIHFGEYLYKMWFSVKTSESSSEGGRSQTDHYFQNRQSSFQSFF